MEQHFIIGTAGHVDHGKTELVKALTGKDTDRLKEEKERGISIELGFAPLRLDNEILAGIIDVPGHERFIKNMLAGVGGMDLVLLVVAADEGIMPQTREHLDIVQLLQVPQGIIVITKVDLVDVDWVDMVEEEIKDSVQDTIFEGSPIIRVSSLTGEGIKELLASINLLAGQIRARKTSGWPRMAVDRVFTITGFGTVATGTLVEGAFKTGDPIEIMPTGVEARIRNLQVHGQKVNQAIAGQRVAVNLAGIEHDQVKRGDVLGWPGKLTPSHRIDMKLHLLKSAPRPLANRARVRLHIGTSEILGRIILLDRDELEAGETTFVQAECEEVMVAAKGDRFVIRSYSPMHTIGGGSVIDSNPPKHKRFNKEVLAVLATKEKGTPGELILQALEKEGQTILNEIQLAAAAALNEVEVKEGIQELDDHDKLRGIRVEGKEHYISEDKFRELGGQLEVELNSFYKNYPLRLGLPKEEIRSKKFSSLSNKVFNALLAAFEEEKMFAVIGDSLALFGRMPKPDAEQERIIHRVVGEFLKGGFQAPAWNDLVQDVKAVQSEEMLNYLISHNILVKLEDNIILHSEVFDQGKEKIISWLQEKGEVTLAEARDLLHSSRKYILPFLNKLDKEKVTRRVQDKRILYR